MSDEWWLSLEGARKNYLMDVAWNLSTDYHEHGSAVYLDEHD